MGVLGTCRQVGSGLATIASTMARLEFSLSKPGIDTTESSSAKSWTEVMWRSPTWAAQFLPWDDRDIWPRHRRTSSINYSPHGCATTAIGSDFSKKASGYAGNGSLRHTARDIA